MNDLHAHHGTVGIDPRLMRGGAMTSSSAPVGRAVGGDSGVSPSDHQLAAEAQAGSMAAFELLVARHKPRLRAFLSRMTGHHAHDTDDLVQETFLRAYRHLGRYRPHWAFSTWLFNIALRLAIDERRKRMRRSRFGAPLAAEPAADAPSPGAAMLEREQGDRVWALAQRTLTEHQYAMLWLGYVERMNVREIGRVMGRSAIAVKVAMHRARRRLARALIEAGIVE